MRTRVRNVSRWPPFGFQTSHEHAIIPGAAPHSIAVEFIVCNPPGRLIHTYLVRCERTDASFHPDATHFGSATPYCGRFAIGLRTGEAGRGLRRHTSASNNARACLLTRTTSGHEAQASYSIRWVWGECGVWGKNGQRKGNGSAPELPTPQPADAAEPSTAMVDVSPAADSSVRTADYSSVCEVLV